MAERMAERYMKDDRATILIVSSATDLEYGGDEGMKLANKIDIKRFRTLCAITKIDLVY